MTSDTGDEVARVTDFKAWLTFHGAHMHPQVQFQEVPSGFSVLAKGSIAANTTIVSCPFSLTITPENSKRTLHQLLQDGSVHPSIETWSERQLICAYICMHDIVQESQNGYHLLKHLPYIRTLPPPDKLRTPLHFTSAELDLFKGSNLYGATVDRRATWQNEWGTCQRVIEAINKDWGAQFSWDRYLTAATYLSSRAFPSTLLSPNPSLESTPSSYPVLLPGIDALNHARAHPVSWVVDRPTSPSRRSSTDDERLDLLISLVLRQPTQKGSELFNNYGPKPNSEFILGYGFSLPNNPDDTIVLKIGGYPPSHPYANRKWEVGRNARGIEPVWQAVVETVMGGQGGDEGGNDEGGVDEGCDPRDQLYAANLLRSMADGLLKRLPPGKVDGTQAPIRPEVTEMLEHYIEGQNDILKSIIQFAQGQEAKATELIAELGLEVDEDGNEEIEGDS